MSPIGNPQMLRVPLPRRIAIRRFEEDPANAQDLPPLLRTVHFLFLPQGSIQKSPTAPHRAFRKIAITSLPPTVFPAADPTNANPCAPASRNSRSIVPARVVANSL